MSKLLVNFLGAPNSGKSTAAAAIFSALKKKDIEPVLVTEFAKEMVIEKNITALAHQEFIMANQLYRLRCAYEYGDLVITDSPILLCHVYNKDASPTLRQYIVESHHTFDNLNLFCFLDEQFKYSMTGRIHNRDEAILIEQKLVDLVDEYQIKCHSFSAMTEMQLVDLILALVE